MANASSTSNPLTRKHEPFGFLVQSQGQGKSMILRHTNETGYVRVAVDFDSYILACEVADKMAAAVQ